MNDNLEEEAGQWLKEENLEKSWYGRLWRGVVFKLGFSKCKHCIYCNFYGDKYRDIRESVMLNEGKCHWAKESTSLLDNEALTKYKRCSAFIPMLYTFKGYGINSQHIKRIRNQRMMICMTVGGWIVALLITLFAWWLN